MTTIARTESLDGLVNDYLDARAAAEKSTERAEELADLIVTLVGEGHRYEVVSGVGVRVDPPSRRWRVEQARMVLLPNQLDEASERVPTLAAAKANLPAGLVDLCRVPIGKARVVKL